MPDDEFDEIIHGNIYQNICINSAIPQAEYQELKDSGKNIVFNAKIKNIYEFVTSINVGKFEWNYNKLRIISEWQDTIRYTFSGCPYWIKKIELERSRITMKHCLSYMRRGIILLDFEEEPFYKRSYDSSSASDCENKPIVYSGDIVYYIPRTRYFVSRSIINYALRQLFINITNYKTIKKILNQLRIWGFTGINELIREDYGCRFINIAILKQIQSKRLRHKAFDIFYGRKLRYNYRP
jgi:hypothetical protein